ncbi:MAG TPA: gfo/Idh/MocA family oxidoreductase [Phycisphaerales bacterium]|nr:gfo/Idh/MocA family oxidoreductase [Phycisphaerales bacterium]
MAKTTKKTVKKTAPKTKTSSGPLRVAGIGTGNIFNSVHIKPLTANPDVKVVALCDIVESKAKALAKEYGVTKTCKNYKDILKLKTVDAVDICTPNKFHSEIAVAALEAGKHVMCEKPDAVSAKEAKRMAAAAKANGKTLMVMRNNRMRPDSQFLKNYIAAGNMGDIYAGRVGWIRRRGIPGKGGWFTTKELSGGGPLIDLGVHMIDLAIWLMGNPKPVAVSGSTYCKFANADVKGDSVNSTFGEAKADGTFDVEDLAMGFVRFDNGACLQIEFSWASNIEQEKNFVELRGEKSGACLDSSQPLKLFTEIEGTLCDILPRVPSDVWDVHGLYLNHFVDVLKGRDKPMFVPQDGVHMIQILDAIYESAKTGKEVQL